MMFVVLLVQASAFRFEYGSGRFKKLPQADACGSL